MNQYDAYRDFVEAFQRNTRAGELLTVTDEMIDAACAAVPDLYRVDAMRAIEAALRASLGRGDG